MPGRDLVLKNLKLWSVLVIIMAVIMVAWQPLATLGGGWGAIRQLEGYYQNLEPASGGFACLASPLTDPIDYATVKKAVESLVELTQIFPHQAHLYYLIGRGYCLLGDYASAARMFPRFTELRPQNPQADLELGFALEKLCPPRGECQKITTKQVWQRAGVLPEHLITNGEAARKREDFARAIDWYRRAEAMGADLRSTIAFTRYQAALKEGREQEAYAALEEAVRMDTGWANADLRFLGWYRYGFWLYEQRNYPLVEEVFIELIGFTDVHKVSPVILSEVFRRLGVSQYILKNFQGALENFEKSILINPNNKWAYISLGRALYEQNNNDFISADENFKMALKIDPEDEQIWKNVISFWKTKGQIEKFGEYCILAKSKGLSLEECTDRN